MVARRRTLSKLAETDAPKNKQEMCWSLSKRIFAVALSMGVLQPKPILPAHAAVEQYLTRDISIEGTGKVMSLLQGFGALKGKRPAVGGGDRTGTYTW
jgi:hypothetical protein